MSELQTTPRLGLFRIEVELHELLDQRQDAMERIAQCAEGTSSWAETWDEIKTVDGLIHEYLKREVKKVDGCAFAIKEFEARAAARSQEAERMKQAADRDAETAKRIKQMVLEVMQEFGEKKLPGRLFTITRQGNGGVRALTIAQPDIVPLEMKRVTIELRADSVQDFVNQFAGRFRVLEMTHPDTKDIRTALERGEGVMGCKLEERGEHIRIK